MIKSTLFAFFLFCYSMSFAETVTVCPPSVDGYKFATMDLTDGDPAKQVDLMPDNWQGPYPLVWTRLKGINVWIRCNYGTWHTQLLKWDRNDSINIGKTYSTCTTTKTPANNKLFNSMTCF